MRNFSRSELAGFRRFYILSSLGKCVGEIRLVSSPSSRLEDRRQLKRRNLATVANCWKRIWLAVAIFVRVRSAPRKMKGRAGCSRGKGSWMFYAVTLIDVWGIMGPNNWGGRLRNWQTEIGRNEVKSSKFFLYHSSTRTHFFNCYVTFWEKRKYRLVMFAFSITRLLYAKSSFDRINQSEKIEDQIAIKPLNRTYTYIYIFFLRS